MLPKCICTLTLGLIACQISVFGQAAAPPPASPRAFLANLSQPPVPSDPLELAGSNAQPVQDASQRAAIVSLLANARALSNVRAYPYDLKTSFTASNSSSSDGTWQLENISPARGSYRWTAQGPNYSVVNLYRNTLLYSNQSAASIPIRLAQVRAAIFYVNTLFGPRASIRTTTANLNGTEVTCALTERMAMPKSTTGGRLWDESEFCVDPKSGLLMTYSPAPGIYISYDYSNALHFHDKIIPGKFTITEAGHTVIEAQNESAGTPANLDPTLFDPAGLDPVGAGPLETPPSNFRSTEFNGASGTNLAMQVVVLHGMITPDGHFTDPEVLASSDSSLNQRALDRFANSQNWRMADDSQQPGASPQSHEVFFTLRFVGPAS